ncbi:Rhodanese-like domain [Trinorchestia longiramus]|nr:Rhodanese-like domain [Trinorchestia longiramus]
MKRTISCIFFATAFISWTTAIPTQSSSDPNMACPSQLEGADVESLLPGIADGSIVLVDVRTPNELLETGIIPGSYNVPLAEIEAAFALESVEFKAQYGFEKPRADKLVITCRSGRRATVAWNSLKELGYCKARVYFGSFLDWQAKNLPIQRV